jgi:hypothetical protein
VIAPLRETCLRAALALAALALGQGVARAETVRLAVVVGANRGHADTATLRYAERDAERVASVLLEVGQVRWPQIAILRSPSARELRAALDRVEATARVRRAAGDKVILLFYYSGHADGLNLELGAETVPFGEIRERLERSAADIRVAFVDSCRAGGITETKGISPGPSFDIVVTDRLDVAGAAFVTSASASESAQESAELESSYFTHYLVSALRGAADADGDKRVTLAEAYQYAYVKTVADTARTIAGAQHPSYAYRLTGRGDLALADLHGARAAIVFPAGHAGDYFITDSPRGEVLAEVVKTAADVRRVAVPGGTYVVGRRDGARFLAVELKASPGAEVSVLDEALRPTTLALGRTKGAGVDLARSVGLGYAVVGGALGSLTSSSEVALLYRARVGQHWIVSPRAAVGFADVADAGLAYEYRALLAELALLRAIPFGRHSLELLVGAAAGGAYARQRLLSGETSNGAVGRAAAAMAIELPVGDRLRATVGWNAGAAFLRLNDEWAARLFLRADIGVGYAF